MVDVPLLQGNYPDTLACTSVVQAAYFPHTRGSPREKMSSMPPAVAA